MKKNCSDPFDQGEFCWTDNHKAQFIGAFFYGYAMQMIPTYIAAKIGFTASLRFSTLLSGLIQLTVPLTLRYSWEIAVVLQAVKGFLAGLFMPGSFDCARKWSLAEEGKSVITLLGVMLSIGCGAGPFMVGMLTERLGWTFPYYLSGAIFVLLFLMQCIFVSDNPAETMFMSSKEKAMFKKKQQAELTSSTGELTNPYKVSLASILRRPSLYCLSVYMFVHLSVYYPEFTVVPFYFNEFLGADMDFLSYLQIGLSLSTALSVIGWKFILSFLDSKVSWFKCRMTLMIVPLVLRSASLAAMPYTGDATFSIVLLTLNDILIGSAFSGGVVTLTYELDPFNGPVVFGIVNGVGEFSGFLVPLMRAGLTNVDTSEAGYWDKYEQRWQWFFLLCGGMGIVGALTLVIGLLCWKNEWKRHSSLSKNIEENKSKIKGDEKGYVALDQSAR